MCSRNCLVAVVVVFAVLALAACQGDGLSSTAPPEADALEAAASAANAVHRVSFPAEDPGPPIYARMTTLRNQIFSDGEYVAIPFYRDPECVPPDFNLLEGLHPPGPEGPGAFGCELMVDGHFIIESDAPLGTFPIRAVTNGPAPVWFVPWSELEAAIADGQLTMPELLALNPLRGTADRFNEMLAPREENHHVVITSRGRLEGGDRFQFNVNHRGDQIRSILIRFH